MVRPPPPGKFVYFALTALGTLASSYCFNYLFFFLRDAYGFTDRDNLLVSAMHGAVYVVAAVQCGRFAERRGPRTSLVVGFGGLAVAAFIGGFLTTGRATVVFAAVYTVVLLFVWPAMEALVVENEPPARVPHMVGLYNATWSGSAALAYFTGGPLYDWLGPGAIFAVPSGLFLVGFGVAEWVRRRAVVDAAMVLDVPSVPAPRHPEASATLQPVPPETFRTLAWVANPLSYVAVYTLLALMPGLASRLGLSATEVGLFCSIWFFGRWAAFLGLWRWTGWHYRFRWLAAAYGVLVGGFVGILLSPVLWGVVVGQVLFGVATGLIYYSSLFYAMDLAEAKAEHGGLHEALIGGGIFTGPAVGAISIWLLPGQPAAGALAVGALLAAGGVGLAGIWAGARRARDRADST